MPSEMDGFNDRIIQGDCIEILKTLPERSVDLVFADPPYNLQLEKELWRPNATRVNGLDETWDNFSSFKSYDRFTQAWLDGCRRILKDTGTIWVIGSYHNIFRVGRILQDLGYWILNDIVWIKNNPMPNFHGVRFTNAHETLIWAQKIKGKRYTFNYQAMKSMNRDEQSKMNVQMRSDWRLPLCTGKERLKVNGEKAHPTQKPEALMERVILASTRQGDIVLDPFFGSGTTGAVAKKLRRHWIGIESNTDYITLAQKRIDAVRPISKLPISVLDESPKRSGRIPFVSLLEEGLLKEGQTLYFGPDSDIEATILEDGEIKLGESNGSIHSIARSITKAPSNGWTAWYYIDHETGRRTPIDQLRKIVRKGKNSNEDDLLLSQEDI
jgi:site-specific DNA-methyltransferase (adenine-specific)